MLLNSYNFNFLPSILSPAPSISCLGTSDHAHSVAHGSGVVLQHHKSQLDGCQRPFSNWSLPKATSWQGSVGSRCFTQSTSAALPQLPPLPRIDATSEHQGYFQPAGVKLPFFFMFSPLLTYKRDSIFLPTHS